MVEAVTVEELDPDDLAQAILFESTDKQTRMDLFLAGGRT